MSNKQGGFIIVLLCGILIAVLVPIYQSRQITRWEYHSDSISDKDFDPAMRIAGERGWELVFARRAARTRSEMVYEMIFKRPLR
jgi:hypothetical protein